jgi:hypothetical protein
LPGGGGGDDGGRRTDLGGLGWPVRLSGGGGCLAGVGGEAVGKSLHSWRWGGRGGSGEELT